MKKNSKVVATATETKVEETKAKTTKVKAEKKTTKAAKPKAEKKTTKAKADKKVATPKVTKPKAKAEKKVTSPKVTKPKAEKKPTATKAEKKVAAPKVTKAVSKTATPKAKAVKAIKVTKTPNGAKVTDKKAAVRVGRKGADFFAEEVNYIIARIKRTTAKEVGHYSYLLKSTLDYLTNMGIKYRMVGKHGYVFEVPNKRSSAWRKVQAYKMN